MNVRQTILQQTIEESMIIQEMKSYYPGIRIDCVMNKLIELRIRRR